ncbi:hypothetical protein EI94DRAFT_921075, partial [Lactarius quietus]
MHTHPSHSTGTHPSLAHSIISLYILTSTITIPSIRLIFVVPLSPTTGQHVHSFHAILLHFWYKKPGSGTVELPLTENEPLGKSPELSDRCELRIEGMTCGACVKSIEGMLRSQPGNPPVKVALLAERGVVEFDPQQWTTDKVINEISDIGFDATLIPPTRSDEITLRIYGMTCSACTSTVETELAKMPGINSVVVALATETAKVVFDHSCPRHLRSRLAQAASARYLVCLRTMLGVTECVHSCPRHLRSRLAQATSARNLVCLWSTLSYSGERPFLSSAFTFALAQVASARNLVCLWSTLRIAESVHSCPR